MDKYLILYNPRAGSSRGAELVSRLRTQLSGESRLEDITSIRDWPAFFASHREEEQLIVTGGDGTLNHFANDTAGLDIPRVLFWPSGSGNDFWRDIGLDENSPPIEINPHLRRLPRLRENGEERLFLNGAGFGLDGYCCAEGNRRRQKSAAPINYTAIAIRGILYDFHPVSAQITVDGKAYTREKVWMAPTMYGRYLGGGMMLAPMQRRSEDGGNLSLLILHDIGRLHILAILSSVYEGKHVKYDQYVEFLRGRHFHVRFDRPTDMQIDGETVSPITEYEAWRDE